MTTGSCGTTTFFSFQTEFCLAQWYATCVAMNLTLKITGKKVNLDVGNKIPECIGSFFCQHLLTYKFRMGPEGHGVKVMQNDY